MRYALILNHGGHEIEMPAGESFVGRSVDCHVRFNDGAISRRHLRVMCTGSGVFVENLSITNGTRVNGHRLLDNRRLVDGDEIEIGHRILSVVLREVEAADGVVEAASTDQVTITGPFEVGPGLLVSQDHLDDDPAEETRPGRGPAGFLADFAAPDVRNCSKCRALVPVDEDMCPTCGYVWPAGNPSSVTQEISIVKLPTRQDPRHIIQVPVIYSSEDLVLDAVARDVSRGGMFIASEILEPVGTECELTLLPDGYGALRFQAKIRHVSTETVNDRPPGFGVTFLSLAPDAQTWLDRVTARVL